MLPCRLKKVKITHIREMLHNYSHIYNQTHYLMRIPTSYTPHSTRTSKQRTNLKQRLKKKRKQRLRQNRTKMLNNKRRKR
jgi:hypothetical protein